MQKCVWIAKAFSHILYPKRIISWKWKPHCLFALPICAEQHVIMSSDPSENQRNSVHGSPASGSHNLYAYWKTIISVQSNLSILIRILLSIFHCSKQNELVDFPLQSTEVNEMKAMRSRSAWLSFHVWCTWSIHLLQLTHKHYGRLKRICKQRLRS